MSQAATTTIISWEKIQSYQILYPRHWAGFEEEGEILWPGTQTIVLLEIRTMSGILIMGISSATNKKVLVTSKHLQLQSSIAPVLCEHKDNKLVL